MSKGFSSPANKIITWLKSSMSFCNFWKICVFFHITQYQFISTIIRCVRIQAVHRWRSTPEPENPVLGHSLPSGQAQLPRQPDVRLLRNDSGSWNHADSHQYNSERSAHSVLRGSGTASPAVRTYRHQSPGPFLLAVWKDLPQLCAKRSMPDLQSGWVEQSSFFSSLDKTTYS